MKPLAYETRRYSQHGEDGIIEVMTNAIRQPNRFVLEIGWGDGTMNMSRNLIEQGWQGIGIDMYHSPHQSVNLPPGFEYRQQCISPGNLEDTIRGTPFDLDFFSLDIDSYDFDIAARLLDLGYRPKTVCVEFNHRFGPKVQASFPYLDGSRPKRVFNKHHFHGVSLAKYQALWQRHGYRFFGFDAAYINLFFYHADTVANLDHLPQHSVDHMPNQADTVLSVVNGNSWWQSRLTDIYQCV